MVKVLRRQPLRRLIRHEPDVRLPAPAILAMMLPVAGNKPAIDEVPGPLDVPQLGRRSQTIAGPTDPCRPRSSQTPHR